MANYSKPPEVGTPEWAKNVVFPQYRSPEEVWDAFTPWQTEKWKTWDEVAKWLSELGVTRVTGGPPRTEPERNPTFMEMLRDLFGPSRTIYEKMTSTQSPGSVNVPNVEAAIQPSNNLQKILDKIWGRGSNTPIQKQGSQSTSFQVGAEPDLGPGSAINFSPSTVQVSTGTESQYEPNIPYPSPRKFALESPLATVLDNIRKWIVPYGSIKSPEMVPMPSRGSSMIQAKPPQQMQNMVPPIVESQPQTIPVGTPQPQITIPQPQPQVVVPQPQVTLQSVPIPEQQQPITSPQPTPQGSQVLPQVSPVLQSTPIPAQTIASPGIPSAPAMTIPPSVAGTSQAPVPDLIQTLARTRSPVVDKLLGFLYALQTGDPNAYEKAKMENVLGNLRLLGLKQQLEMSPLERALKMAQLSREEATREAQTQRAKSEIEKRKAEAEKLEMMKRPLGSYLRGRPPMQSVEELPKYTPGEGLPPYRPVEERETTFAEERENPIFDVPLYVAKELGFSNLDKFYRKGDTKVVGSKLIFIPKDNPEAFKVIGDFGDIAIPESIRTVMFLNNFKPEDIGEPQFQNAYWNWMQQKEDITQASPLKEKIKFLEILGGAQPSKRGEKEYFEKLAEGARKFGALEKAEKSVSDLFSLADLQRIYYQGLMKIFTAPFDPMNAMMLYFYKQAFPNLEISRGTLPPWEEFEKAYKEGKAPSISKPQESSSPTGKPQPKMYWDDKKQKWFIIEKKDGKDIPHYLD